MRSLLFDMGMLSIPIHRAGLALLVLVFALASPAHAIELLWENESDFYGEDIRSVVYPDVDEEAADDFEVLGTIERLIVYGSNDCTFGCYEPPQPTGVWVRFYESTSSGPGQLQYEEFLPGGDPGFLHDEEDGAAMLDITLAVPFEATGRHFLSVQLEYDEGFNWKIGPSHDNSPEGSHAMWRDNAGGGGWEQAKDFWGDPVSQDLAFDLYGCPTGGCEPPPLVAGCGEWVEIDSPNPAGAEDAILNDVDVLAPHDVWAVGSWDGPLEGATDDRQQSLALHWDGTSWSIVPSPSPGPNASTVKVTLEGVSAVSTNDVWAVGRKRDQDEGGYTGGRVLAMHWDGFEWVDMNAPWPSNYGSPYTGASGEQLHDVVALDTDDVWMVGRWWVEESDGVVTWPGVAMHWNGSDFTPFELPFVSSSKNQWALAVDAVSPDDVWAVGAGEGSGAHSHIWHWDGTSWTHVPGPAPGQSNRLEGVVALAADDVWAGGTWRDESHVDHPFIIHWDGTSWTEVTTPAGGSDFAAWATDDVLTHGHGGWAHWDGTSWTLQTGPTVIPSGRFLALDTINPCAAWAVGTRTRPGRGATLTEKLRSADNPADDTDGDGVPNSEDNCPEEHNPDQADCDGDGTGDACELSSGEAEDCNGNGQPDNCETFDDCDGNGIPDTCQADCNGNGLPDTCDIADGRSDDCNGDGTPDECETFDDCNRNGINDTCDVDGGDSQDSNGNGYPDECEALGPNTATVTTPADIVDFAGAQQLGDLPGPDGVVSFREAVIAVNNTPGAQTIAVNVPKSLWDTTLYEDRVILRIDDGLFQVTDDETTIDFTTQEQFTGDTNPDGGEVGFYGYQPNAWGVTAILISADRCEVRGLDRVMQRGHGVEIRGNDNRIVGNYISGQLHSAVYIRGNTDDPPLTGNVVGGTSADDGNRLEGVRIDGPAENNSIIGNRILNAGVTLNDAHRNRIGGPAAEERNTIAGAGSFDGEGCPGGAQITLAGSDDNVIEGNYVGTTSDGLAGYGQIGTAGIRIRDSLGTVVRNNLISDILVVGQNHCSGDRFGVAVEVQGSSAQTLIIGNMLGTDAAGEVAIPNRAGVEVESWPGSGSPTATTIGGLGAGEGNVLANAELDGIRVGGSVGGVTISANSIRENGELGIDLSGTGNGGQASPTLTSAVTDDVSISIEGTLSAAPSALHRIEFFASPSCDPSGFGEGHRFLGYTEVTTDASGDAAFDVTFSEVVTAGDVVTATATELASGNTSEFSACETVTQGACSSPPDQVTGLMVGHDGDHNHVSWDAFGPSIVYDVARGFTSELSDTDPECLADDIPDAWYDDAGIPGPGRSYYYLARAVNDCGDGPWSDGGVDPPCP